MQMWLMKLKCNEKQVWYEARLTKKLKKITLLRKRQIYDFVQIFWPSQNVFLILTKPFISEPCFVVYTKLPVTQHAHCLVGRFWFEIMPQWTLWSMSQGLQRGSIYSKIQQTKMLVTCQRFGDLFLFGLVWPYSSNQKNIMKVGSKSLLLTCSSNKLWAYLYHNFLIRRES